MKWILSLYLTSLALSMTACGSPPNQSTLPPGNYDPISQVAEPVGREVDAYFSAYGELLKPRETETYLVDSCQNESTFAGMIADAVGEALQPRHAQIAYVARAFSLPDDEAQWRPTSLSAHKFCPATAASLRDTLGKTVPPHVVHKAMAFTNQLNDSRRLALQGDAKGLLDLHRLWSKFMMCLAYTESLTTADTQTSRNLAIRYNIHKPDGVKFYFDRAQSNPASQFNLGLYQFSPSAGGNVQACLRAWNLRNPACALDLDAPFRDLADHLASSRQSFNAFCGVTKVTDMFAVQVNTNQRKSTHPDNRARSGLITPEERCVTPFFRSGASYNHFGPFQNSTGKNLDSLLSCALKR